MKSWFEGINLSKLLSLDKNRVEGLFGGNDTENLKYFVHFDVSPLIFDACKDFFERIFRETFLVDGNFISL